MDNIKYTKTKRVLIEVKPKHIRAGQPCAYYCPIALSIMEKIPLPVRVSPSGKAVFRYLEPQASSIYNLPNMVERTYITTLSKQVRRFIRKFDSTARGCGKKHSRPFSFYLNWPTELSHFLKE